MPQDTKAILLELREKAKKIIKISKKDSEEIAKAFTRDDYQKELLASGYRVGVETSLADILSLITETINKIEE